VHYETNKTPAFTNRFPHGKIPAWDGKDGFKLFEGLAIARYCACPSILDRLGPEYGV
jgi:elongation factor 1-gamma